MSARPLCDNCSRPILEIRELVRSDCGIYCLPCYNWRQKVFASKEEKIKIFEAEIEDHLASIEDLKMQIEELKGE